MKKAYFTKTQWGRPVGRPLSEAAAVSAQESESRPAGQAA